MRDSSLAITLLLLGQSLGAQTHTTKPTSNPLTWYTQTGTGMSGEFQTKNAANSNPALYATTNGKGPAGSFVATGSGYGVLGQAASGVGGSFRSYGSNNGVYGESSSGNGGYFVSDSGGYGVYGQSASGFGGYFVNGDGTGYALYAQGGYGGCFAANPNNIGVYATTSGYGTAVSGSCSNGGTGVAGSGFVGVEGDTIDPNNGLAGYFTANVEVQGNLMDDSEVFALDFVTTSDARYKTHVATLTHALDKVLALRGVTYDWRTEQFPEKRFGKGRQVGFIAQEVEKILPQIVSKDRNGYRAVDYSKVVPVLVEAIKEQQAQIEEQQIQIQEQANVNHAQQQQITSIEAQVRQVQAAAFSGKTPALGALLALGAGGSLALSRRRRKSRP